MSEPGLDAAFLRHIGYDPVKMKLHQRFYLPFYAGCQRVVDLGCGGGDFVELLVERGIDAIGVDSDPTAVESMLTRGLNGVNQDALTYLGGLAAESIDGVFAAHLVEHMSYKQVLELIRLSFRALKPGGVIVLTTPDPRSLFAQLDMFYLHFGHVTWYHPDLLCFFIEHVGFVNTEFDNSDSPVQSRLPLFELPEMHPIRATLPIWRKGFIWRVLRAVRTAVAYVFLNPYLDLIHSNFRQMTLALQRVDRPFECYAKGTKPCAELPVQAVDGPNLG